MAKLSLIYPNIQEEAGQIHSIADTSLYLTFGIWIYLVPQYKPESVLMLGYGGGTAAKYIRLFYGEDVPITAVDFSDVSEFLTTNTTWVNEDAEEYVKKDVHFDTVIVDLYDTNDFHPQGFVFSKEFADNLARIGNYLIVHTVVGDDMSAYKDFKLIRTLNIGRKDEYAPEVHYYMINDIPRLPVR